MIHRKHPKIERPQGGQFHRVEFSLIGAPCSVIDRLSNSLIKNLPNYKLAYANADHSIDDTIKVIEGYVDKINYQQFNVTNEFISKRLLFNSYDGVIINGNHFNAESQIIILNSRKKESLKRKIDRLTNPILILIDDVDTPYSFLQDVKDFESVPILSINDLDAISSFINTHMTLQRPKILGCILSGGKSERMGEDKALLNYHGMPQLSYLQSLFEKLSIPTVVSVSALDVYDMDIEQNGDEFLNFGPLGGILTAMKKYPNNAILTCPCDAPLVDAILLDKLIKNRDPNKIATCFYNPETDFPEPLITLWEPKAYGIILQFISLGYSCPRKVLINSSIMLIDLEKESFKLANVNTPEESSRIKSLINKMS